MTNWEACKYESLLTLQNDAAKNSLWRSTALNIPRNSSSITTQNKGQTPMPMPPYIRSHGNIGETLMAIITVLEVTEVKMLLLVN